MASARDGSLPSGMSDLIDKIREEEIARNRNIEERQQQLRQLRLIMEQGEWLQTATIFEILCQRIDHDLLFTEDFDLVRPKIHEIVLKEWTRVFNKIKLMAREDIKQGIIETTVRGVWVIVCQNRPRYVGDRCGSQFRLDR